MPISSSPSLEKFDQFAKLLVASGRYETVDKVLDAAMQALMREECDEQAKEAFLIQALADEDASGIFEGDPFESIRLEMGWAKLGFTAQSRLL